MNFLNKLSLARPLRKLAGRIEKRHKFKRALKYNKEHTFSSDGKSAVGGTWCCPTCNAIHECISNNKITGRQFPACCEFEEGHRMFSEHATGL